MLRNLLFIAAVMLCLGSVAARLAGYRGTAPFALWGGAIAAAVALERWRYRSRSSVQGADWQKTDERFVDPESGRAMQVFYNPRTGERRYEEAPDA